MVFVTQQPGNVTYAPPVADDVGIAHVRYVRDLRTHVNVESERTLSVQGLMPGDRTLGAQLRDLVHQSGLSYDAVASRAGYSGRSSVQRYFSEEYDAEFLPMKVADKLARAFEGTPVNPAAVKALAGFPEPNAFVHRFEGAADITLQRDLPIYGTALGAPRDFDGRAVEQTMLNTGEIIGYLPRPPILNGVRHAYALFVQGSSMSPRFEDGETLLVTDSRSARPPKIGDDVVVYLRDEGTDDGETATGVLVKRLVRRTGSFVELQQFTPALTFKIEADRVLRIDRVIPWAEILA